MKYIILIAFCVSTLCAQPNQDELVEKNPSTKTDTVVIEQPKPKKSTDYRYQIVGGVTMMLFFGLALGLTQSNNPR